MFYRSLARTSVVSALALMGFTASTFAADARGVTKDEIAIGMTLPLSGGVAVVGLAAQAGATAYIRAVNDAGGVNGRKIRLVAYDDKYVVANTVTNIKRLVLQDNVFALVASPVGGPQTEAIADYARQEKVPVIGPFQGLPSLSNAPYVFPTWATIRDQQYAVTEYLVKTQGMKKVAAIYYNDASGAATRQGVEDAAKANNIQTVATIPFEPTTADLTSEVQKARDAGADGVVIMGGTGHVGAAMKAAATLGWKPRWGGHTTISDPALVKLAGDAAEGAVGANIFFLPDEKSPGMTEFFATMKKYYPDVQPGSFHISGYTAAKLLVAGLKAVPGDLTLDKFMAALESGKNIDVGTLPGLSYTTKKHIGNARVQVIQIRKGVATPVAADWVTVN